MTTDDQGGAYASLAAKIRTLDLSADEARALADMAQRALDAGGDVEGFGTDIGSLGFDRPAVAPDRTTGFKGTDEELQALIAWAATRR